jgi:hypothetical protein
MPIVTPTTTPVIAPVATPVVADIYDLLVGIDTHAATHTFAIVDAATGAAGEHREFPTSPAGLRRALAWVQHRTEGRSVLVLVDGIGSYGAVLAEQLIAAGFLVAEAPDIPAHVRRANGKTDHPRRHRACPRCPRPHRSTAAPTPPSRRPRDPARADHRP